MVQTVHRKLTGYRENQAWLIRGEIWPADLETGRGHDQSRQRPF